MARRRGIDKPVEKLRSSWESTADLEETLASMFHRDTVPGDKLAGDTPPAPPPKEQINKDVADHPPATLTASTDASLTGPSQDSLSAAPADSLAAPTPASLTSLVPDNLSRHPGDNLAVAPPVNQAGAVYQTLEGLVVDAKCIHPFDAAQNGHTLTEHLVYTTMWRMLGSQGSDPESREGILPMRLIAGKVSLSLRNLRRVLHSLVDKLAVDVTEFEDKTKSIPRRYRVWSPAAVVARRRKAGYTHVYRNRNLITLARPADRLTGPS